MKIKSNIAELFTEAKINQMYVKVSAPMVRYSKVHFRTLVRNYGVDLCFTPMILADSFCQNAKARTSEFLTMTNDSPLIVQFAANNVEDFVDASKLVYPYADGVDLNCGCPQRWAMKDGYGSALLSKPEVIYDLIRNVRNNLPKDFSISVKIRILKDLKQTVNMCQQLERCGVNFITVHGRTPSQKSGDNIDLNALKTVCNCVQIPIVANGGVKSLEDADELCDIVKCSGVMAASGLLTNPALFSGAKQTPLNCVKLWMDLKDTENITYQCYHHHLVFMLEKILTKQQKQVFNHLSTFESVDEYLYNNLIDPVEKSNDSVEQFVYRSKIEYVNCQFDDTITLKHSRKCRGCGRSACYCVCVKYDCNLTNGIFFTSFVKENDELDFMDCNMFNETT